mgnify:FL=1
MNAKIYQLIAIIIYALGIIVLTYFSKRRKQTIQSFSVGTKQVNPILIGLSLAVGMTSAATFVINPGLVYLYGISGFIGYGIAAPLGIFLALIVISKRFYQFGEQSKVYTVPQWIGERYKSNTLRIFYALVAFLQITFAVLIAVGITIVLANSFQISYSVVLILVLAFSIGYLIIGGGVNVLIFANTFQAIIMIIVAILFLLSGPIFLKINPFEIKESLANIDANLTGLVNPKSLLFRDWFEVFIANFLVGIAIICQPHIISKALYLKSEKDVNKYLWTVVIVGTLFFAVLFTGLYARVALNSELLKADHVISNYINIIFPPFILAIITLGILLAGFSTLENIFVALSSIFSIDILKEVFKKRFNQISEEKVNSILLLSTKIFLIILGIIIYFLSMNQIEQPNLSVAIFAQNGVYGLFITTFWPILFGLFFKNVHKLAVFIFSLIALIVHFGFYYLKITIYHNNPGVTAAFALLISKMFVIIYLIIYRNKIK